MRATEKTSFSREDLDRPSLVDLFFEISWPGTWCTDRFMDKIA